MAAREIWEQTSAPQRDAEFRLFFAVYGRALQAPGQFSDFLDHVVADWMNSLRDTQGPHTDPATATREATLTIATIRGLLLDLLATGDQARVHDAAHHFLSRLQSDPEQSAGCGTVLCVPAEVSTIRLGRPGIPRCFYSL
ncbi:hypothetical protein [Streptomyces sp. NPDC060322]|uniref:hypothetical protein n=1 Tax=Streptomyces sp. NPDC060322 TaxID=3347097 RepID=UPI00364AF081